MRPQGCWAAQKQLIADLYDDAGRETPRILEAMQTADDFDLQKAAQVKLDKCTYSRVALLGDAGYCPSPFTAMGTSLAITGAYVLAGEILQQRDNIPVGLQKYERELRPLVTKLQKLAPGEPWIMTPDS